MKLVSVIIPIYNSSLHIEECLNSVINQSYKNLEILVIDDCSSDNSVDIVKGFNDKRIKIIRLKKHCGVSKARNTGITASKGRYICFLDSDDYWTLDKIEKQIEFMQSNKYSFVFSDYYFLRKGRRHRARTPFSVDYVGALKNTTIFTSTVMIDTDLIDKKHIKMPNFKIGQDSACWWSILKKGYIAYSLREPLATYRVRDGFVSLYRIKRLLGAWKIYSSQNLSFIKKLYYYIYHIVNAIKRRIF